MVAKFNFILPDDILQRIRVIAQERQQTVSALINELLRDFVDSGFAYDEIQRRLTELEQAVEQLKQK